MRVGMQMSRCAKLDLFRIKVVGVSQCVDQGPNDFAIGVLAEGQRDKGITFALT